MFKRSCNVLLIIFIMAVLATVGFARSTPTNVTGKVVFQGNDLALSRSLVELDGDIYAPLHDLAGALRFKSLPSAMSSAVKVVREEDSRSVLLYPYNKNVKINDEPKQWPTFPIVIHGVLYVPLKEFSEAFGYSVNVQGDQMIIGAPGAAAKATVKAEPVPVVPVVSVPVISTAKAIVTADERPRSPVIAKLQAEPVIPVVNAVPSHVLVTTGRYDTITANSCWLPDLSGYAGKLMFNVRGRIFTNIGEQVRGGVLYVPAQKILGPFDYAVHYSLPSKQIAFKRGSNGHQTTVFTIPEGSLNGMRGGQPISFSYPLIIENGRVYIPLVDVLHQLKIGCRWGSLEDTTVYIEPLIEEVYVKDDGGARKVVIAGSEPIEVKNAVEMKDPDRIILDIPNSILNLPRQSLVVNDSGIKGIRISQFKDDVSRIVLDMESMRTYGLGADASGKDIIVDFVPWITMLKVMDGKKGVHIEIDATAALTPQQKVLTDPDRIVLTFPGAVLKTNGYVNVNKGGVQRVRASQFSWQPLMTRVVIDCDGPLHYSIQHSGTKSLIYFGALASTPVTHTTPPVDVTVPITTPVIVPPPDEGTVVPVVTTTQTPNVQTSPVVAALQPRYSSAGLKGKRIVIDPGHGGTDPGAIGKDGSKEKDLTLTLSKMLYKLLLDDGAQPLLILEDDMFMSMEDRARFAERNKADVVISIHLNSFIKPSVRGVESYWYKDNDLDLARIVHETVVSELRLPDKGIKQSQMYILNHTTMPGVLIEPAYLSNPDDAVLIRSQQFRYNVAVAIRNGLRKYFSKAGS